MATPHPRRSFLAARAPASASPPALARALGCALALAGCAAGAGPAGAAPAPSAVAGGAAPAPSSTAARPAGRVPVLVELFTSEGCSSCPPADDVLARLVRTQPIDGVEVVGLSEHVDYWNSGEFRDAYSSAIFTRRQEGYSAAFGQNRVYTPQAVIGGRREVLGSDEGAVRRAALAAAQEPSGRATLRARAGKDEVALRLEVSGLPPQAGAEIRFALLEDGLSTEVARGENAGRTLRHAAVVRVLRTAGAGSAQAAEMTLPLDPSWKRESLRAVAFVQESATQRILAVARAPVE